MESSLAVTSPPTGDQQAVVTFLSDPCSYPGRPKAVEVIETHMSLVFIAGDRAYKMKKPICLSFVDFTSLEARRRNCEREVALNQRLAPGVYLGLVPVTRLADGRLALGGVGESLDWLVVMRRLDPNRLLSSMIGQGKARPAHIERLCELLARFYSETSRIDVSPAELLAWWREHLEPVEASLTDPAFNLPGDAVARAMAALREFLASDADLIAARAAEGRIIDGHGDLRPEHVHVGTPMLLIDRLEFAERLRWVDAFGEAVYLGMECERLGAPWVETQLIEGLTKRLEDEPPVVLLRFYRCYRACLRAGLSIEHLRDPKPRTPERWPRQAREYLEISLRSLPAAKPQS